MSVLAVGFAGMVRLLERTTPEFKAPAPAASFWLSEDDFGPEDAEPNGPSGIMTALTSDSKPAR